MPIGNRLPQNDRDTTRAILDAIVDGDSPAPKTAKEMMAIINERNKQPDKYQKFLDTPTHVKIFRALRDAFNAAEDLSGDPSVLWSKTRASRAFTSPEGDELTEPPEEQWATGVQGNKLPIRSDANQEGDLGGWGAAAAIGALVVTMLVSRGKAGKGPLKTLLGNAASKATTAAERTAAKGLEKLTADAAAKGGPEAAAQAAKTALAEHPELAKNIADAASKKGLWERLVAPSMVLGFGGVPIAGLGIQAYEASRARETPPPGVDFNTKDLLPPGGAKSPVQEIFGNAQQYDPAKVQDTKAWLGMVGSLFTSPDDQIVSQLGRIILDSLANQAADAEAADRIRRSMKTKGDIIGDVFGEIDRDPLHSIPLAPGSVMPSDDLVLAARAVKHGVPWRPPMLQGEPEER